MIAIDVEGMTCMGCVKSVKNALAKADPAATVDVNLETGRVEIESAAPRAALVEAIENAGYDVKA
jgi:copper chaperone